MVNIMENPIKMNDLVGFPIFLETSIETSIWSHLQYPVLDPINTYGTSNARKPEWTESPG